jgi:hypothetical protein
MATRSQPTLQVQITAFLDACGLYPAVLRDTLLRAAEARLFRPLWSVEVPAELRRGLIQDARAAPASVERLVLAMQRAFPTAEVIGYEQILDRMRNHPKDRHALAAAIIGGATIVVTHNVRDFRDEAVVPQTVEVQAPDEFLCRLYGNSPTTMVAIVEAQAAAYSRPAFAVADVIDVLARHAPVFADRLRARLASSSA